MAVLIFAVFLSYLRPLPEPPRLLFEFELLVELVPLLRVLLLVLPTRLLELPLVPLLRVLLLELFTLPLVLPLVPLGRLLLFELFTRPLELLVVPTRPLELPLLVFGRVLVPLRPLDEPPLLTLGRLLSELPLLGVGAGGLLVPLL